MIELFSRDVCLAQRRHAQVDEGMAHGMAAEPAVHRVIHDESLEFPDAISNRQTRSVGRSLKGPARSRRKQVANRREVRRARAGESCGASSFRAQVPDYHSETHDNIRVKDRGVPFECLLAGGRRLGRAGILRSMKFR